MPVEMVGDEVEENRDPRTEPVDVLELEARELADDPGVLVECSVEARQRAPDVAGDGDGPFRGPEHGPKQLARRRLPIRAGDPDQWVPQQAEAEDRKSTRLNSSHSQISYAVFCLKKKKD